MKNKTENSLDGWSRIIRESGEQNATKETPRRQQVAGLIATYRELPDLERLKQLLLAHQRDDIRYKELMKELYSWVGI